MLINQSEFLFFFLNQIHWLHTPCLYSKHTTARLAAGTDALTRAPKCVRTVTRPGFDGQPPSYCTHIHRPEISHWWWAILSYHRIFLWPAEFVWIRRCQLKGAASAGKSQQSVFVAQFRKIFRGETPKPWRCNQVRKKKKKTAQMTEWMKALCLKRSIFWQCAHTGVAVVLHPPTSTVDFGQADMVAQQGGSVCFQGGKTPPSSSPERRPQCICRTPC